MSNRAEKAKEFLGNWYIIHNAKNWFDFGVSFNMIGSIREYFWRFHLVQDRTKYTDEEIFEMALQQYIEEYKERKKQYGSDK